MIRLYTTPFFIRMLYPSLVWKMPDEGKKIYLTFDDGPHPIITVKVLELLKKYNAKATFFCVGNNVKANKEVVEKIREDGHSIGNHTFNHEKGWITNTDDYIKSVEETRTLVNSVLLRPPHGRIRFSQLRKLKKHYKIIAWTVISYDWDKNLTADDCYRIVINKARNGSIVVFHDSEKAEKNMLPALEKVLEYYTNKGYSFERL